MPAPKSIRRLGAAIALLVGLLLAAGIVLLGPMDAVLLDRERNVVLLDWDATTHRLTINQRVRPPLALDGPYVRRRGDGTFEVMRTVERGGRWRAARTLLTLQHGRPVALEVQVDNPPRTRFEVALRGPAAVPPAITPATPARLLLLSDLEGDFDALVSLLRAHGVIDEALHWRFGAGHVGLAGDFVDRGEHVLPLLWLIYRLEGEAAQAGGRVHYLLGNHELRALHGDFADAPQRIFASRDAFFGGDNRAVFAADTVLGEWLRAHNVIERIGDTLVVHAGISETFLEADLDLATANAIARRELDVDGRRLSAQAQPVIGRHGLPWYRGTARPDKAIESDRDAHLDAVLRRYGVRRIALGHALAPHVRFEQQGRVLRLNVDHTRQTPEGALLERGRWWRVDAQGGRVAL